MMADQSGSVTNQGRPVSKELGRTASGQEGQNSDDLKYYKDDKDIVILCFSD